MKKLLFGALAVALISGCAFSNEGKVDYRHTNKNNSIIKIDDCGNEITDESGNNKKDTNLQVLIAKNCSLGPSAKFRKGDFLSLHLKTAYINEFSEQWLSSLVTKAFTSQWAKTDGEIVIIANAFEEAKGKELEFHDLQAGRVVFYSDDVLEKQFLNFNNMPIYGPISYEGAPFAFRISILELDVVSEQTKALLNMVASAGSIAYPPASPVLGVLNGIGSSMLDGPQIDTGFRYTVVFDPSGGSDDVNHVTLEVGNYVIARVEKRDEFFPWNDVILNENEGKLYWKNKKDTDGKRIPYTESTYLVVEINNGVSNVEVELAQNNFGELLAFLQEQDKKRAVSWKQTQNAVMNIAIKRSQIVNFGTGKEITQALGKPDSTVSKEQKRVKAENLFTMIANSVDDGGKILDIDPENSSESYDLSESQIQYLLENIMNLKALDLDEEEMLLLGTESILEAFRGKLDKTTTPNTRTPVASKKKQILDLVSPL